MPLDRWRLTIIAAAPVLAATALLGHPGAIAFALAMIIGGVLPSKVSP